MLLYIVYFLIGWVVLGFVFTVLLIPFIMKMADKYYPQIDDDSHYL